MFVFLGVLRVVAAFFPTEDEEELLEAVRRVVFDAAAAVAGVVVVVSKVLGLGEGFRANRFVETVEVTVVVVVVAGD